MKFKKLIISIVLLLSYFLGFAHNLIPHCDELSEIIAVSKTQSSHQNFNHQHHQTNDNQTNHEHISHQNHYDESVLDLAICFLNEIDTPQSDCNAEHCVLLQTDDNSTKTISTKDLVKVLFVAIQNSLKIVYLPVLTQQNFPPNHTELLPNPLRVRSNSLRAPPLFS
mgnify:CR=1 FL=1|jgi:hypothetical protein